MRSAIEADVKAFIIDNFLFGDETLAPETDASLLHGGVIDSTGVLELIFFIEDRFGISIADTEMVPQNLDSIARIVEFVDAKRSAQAA